MGASSNEDEEFIVKIGKDLRSMNGGSCKLAEAKAVRSFVTDLVKECSGCLGVKLLECKKNGGGRERSSNGGSKLIVEDLTKSLPLGRLYNTWDVGRESSVFPFVWREWLVELAQSLSEIENDSHQRRHHGGDGPETNKNSMESKMTLAHIVATRKRPRNGTGQTNY